MKFWKAALPNLTIALNVVLMIAVYLDMRNPMMGFLSGRPFVTLAACSCICSIATAVVLYADWRKTKEPDREKQEKNLE